MKNFIANAKSLATKAIIFGAPAVGLCTTTAFASSDPLPSIAITQDMLKPLLDGVVSNVGVILPVGLGLFSILLGVKLIPRLISRFLSM